MMKSPYLEDFLKSTGNAVHNINTICVGLAAVSEGNFTKPDDLTISWHTDNPVVSSRKGRAFMLKASLMYIDDAISTYLKDIRPLTNDKTLTAILTRKNPQFVEDLEVEFKKNKPDLFKWFNSKNKFARKGDENDQLYINIDSADRLRSLNHYFEFSYEYWVPAAILLNKWRNRIVHKTSVARPELSELNALINHKESIREKHSNIDIELTIQHFENNKITLKDITTLIAISILMVREIDKQLYSGISSLELIDSYVIRKNLTKEYNNIASEANIDLRKRKFKRFVQTKVSDLDEATLNYLFDDFKKLN